MQIVKKGGGNNISVNNLTEGTISINGNDRRGRSMRFQKFWDQRRTKPIRVGPFLLLSLL